MAAKPTFSNRILRRDADAYDAYCDHLLVLDRSARSGHQKRSNMVGTYRLLRQEIAGLSRGFYTASEYDIAPLLARHPSTRFLELGRSCVAPGYRDKRTVELLWHGIWTYIHYHKIDALFGCASFSSTDVDALAIPLSFLHHKALAPPEWRVKARPERHIPMDCVEFTSIDPRAAIAALPPLIKGYLRVGARFGEGAVIDHQFGTTDVLVILPVEFIQTRYIN
ncbi:MAG: GNAT family N-acetyltransferase, partial [Microcystis sp.]